MKKLLSLAAVYLIGHGSIAQNQILLKPGAVEGKDAEIGLIVPNTNYGSSTKGGPYAWTQNTELNIVRSLMEFSLSALPKNAVIKSAKLSLFHNPDFPGVPHHNGYNPIYIQRILTEWKEDEVTWNTQPFYSENNKVGIPNSQSPTQDYMNLNVTGLLKDALADSLDYLGLMVRLEDESPYSNVMLASSDHPDQDLHPQLVIDYELTTDIKEKVFDESFVNIYPNPSRGNFNVDLTEKVSQVKIQLMDLTGKVILNEKMVNTEHIEIDALANPGSYILNLEIPGYKPYHRKLSIL